ncbi:LD-carboxypeptidase [Chitinophaga horti]|uniref:LD-carboxypeptidase n=1 Tax=Chitinophaga horti TaxID=2920382 RepID=A0ABY6J9Q6_9BACT|nr:LD-carboxypeptidase [Chitinophaga horti]UYQ95039.1 LD-carboxypeptidase [Chitinophaga horti]
MDRKHFLSALVTAGAAMPAFGAVATLSDERPTQVPPYLKAGSTVGITSPAGHITRDEIAPSVKLMESWGFKVVIGDTIGKSDFSFGGTDEERYRDLQRMLDDPQIDAIMCARGGYGSARIVDRLSLEKFKKHPKWVIGFSDITVLHSHIAKQCSIATLHSKMCNSFPIDFSAADSMVQDTILSIRDALTGKAMRYNAAADPNNRIGKADGVLVGGNLSMLVSVAGTRSEMDTKGKILFLEEVGEYLYSLDRMMGNLQRSGKLDQLAGLIIGGFNRIKPDDPGEEFGRTLYDIVYEKVKDYKYPICFNFPVGHQRNNYALKCGVRHRLDVTAGGVKLEEVKR